MRTWAYDAEKEAANDKELNNLKRKLENVDASLKKLKKIDLRSLKFSKEMFLKDDEDYKKREA